MLISAQAPELLQGSGGRYICMKKLDEIQLGVVGSVAKRIASAFDLSSFKFYIFTYFADIQFVGQIYFVSCQFKISRSPTPKFHRWGS